jgi:hypothetical protein
VAGEGGMTTKVSFTADGSIEVRNAPNPEMPNYMVTWGVVALTPDQARTAILMFGWRKFNTVAGLIEVIRSEEDWRRARKAASNANAYI